VSAGYERLIIRRYKKKKMKEIIEKTKEKRKENTHG
jgi:hypothetical protein